MPKITDIPIVRSGRPRKSEYDELARDVSQLSPGKAIERDVPGGRDAHIYRSQLRQALTVRGVPCETAVISPRRVSIWPVNPVENFDSL